MSEYVYPNNTPLFNLDCVEAFTRLNEKEKRYAHFMSQASYIGGLIVLSQTSLESPLICKMLFKVFQAEPVSELKKIALTACNFTDDEYLAFILYACGIFHNMGNYKGFGDTKFIPNLDKDKFRRLLYVCKYGRNNPQDLQSLLNKCLDKIYSLTDAEKQLDFPNKGTTTYLSRNITSDDNARINEFLKANNIEAWNTRAFKTVDETGNSCYEIRLASVLGTDDKEAEEVLKSNSVNGHKFLITRGDYNQVLSHVNEALASAKDCAANENQEKMLEHYIKSFHSGSLEAHKDGSRFWIKDKGPVIESYIGFIENYRDPAGMRAEFEGFVAMVNKKLSEKFTELVRAAESFVSMLPWPKVFETDAFLKPDFTLLDVLCFAASSLPAGICIPNYEEIRQCEGFKNVALGNVIQSKMSEPPNYTSVPDQELVMKYKVAAYIINVALHELLGHGSGKLLRENEDGNLNFNPEETINFETGQKVTKWYKKGEDYSSVFGAISSAYEECRAECVALYLGDVQDILKIFGHESPESETITYVLWMIMVLSGIEGLQMYDPKSEKWGQAHCQARYVILQVLLEAGEGLLTLEKTVGADGNPDLRVTLDRTKISTVGKKAIGKFLSKLQLYRSTADIAAAKEMFNRYSLVTSEDKYPFLDYKEIVMARKKPRNFFVLPNTRIDDGKVKLITYDPTPEGMMQSWMDRFQDLPDLDTILEGLWEDNKIHFS